MKSASFVLKRGVLTFFGGYCTREATVRSLPQMGQSWILITQMVSRKFSV